MLCVVPLDRAPYLHRTYAPSWLVERFNFLTLNHSIQYIKEIQFWRPSIIPLEWNDLQIWIKHLHVAFVYILLIWWDDSFHQRVHVMICLIFYCLYFVLNVCDIIHLSLVYYWLFSFFYFHYGCFIKVRQF